jgi:SAM-dependent methyltransferase
VHSHHEQADLENIVVPSVHVDDTDHSTYDPAHFEHLFAVEDRHFWFRARNWVIAALVRQVTAGLEPGYRVLEVGCGTGNVLRILEDTCTSGEVTGMDLFAEGLEYARRRVRCDLVCGDIHALPFDHAFHLIGLFDVLEHLPDDVQALRDLHAALEPGGSLLLTVPAHTSLWSYFDEASHHCRRYQAADLKSKLLRNGYHIEYMTEYMAALFPLMWFGRRIARLFKRPCASVDELATQELRVRPFVNEVLYRVLEQEAHLIEKRKHLPVGTSLLVAARKV